MRREGRQHGKIITFGYIEEPSSKLWRKIDKPVMGGVYAKAPSKPTNRSRYTSRCSRPGCRGCHQHPVNKSRAKTKGMHKHKEPDVALLDEGYRIAMEACEPGLFSDDDGRLDDGETAAEERSHGFEPVTEDRGDGGRRDLDGEWVMVEIPLKGSCMF
ncbi:hypothetical protein HPP92_009916 [Vanilla planifolia]|uniref:Uncharacterized protein n=1 Tax=Vanilla planifolia TaxID=51239 RepID=A0A835RGP5_VANPL|nr:hypothetical protein HPP92_009916 [Vanilla planifolia]